MTRQNTHCDDCGHWVFKVGVKKDGAQTQWIAHTAKVARSRKTINDGWVRGDRCVECKKRFNERTGTPMARLRTPQVVVEAAL